MDIVSVLKDQLDGAHELLEATMADVTPEQANWPPPGRANPLGATYAHALSSEDAVVNGMLRGTPLLLASMPPGNAGLSELPPADADYGEWARRVRIEDLGALKAYAQAVYKSTSDWVGSLSAADLEREIDLTGWGLGKQTLGWVLGRIVVWHVDAHCGEVSCLKGLQGAKGYPF